MMLLVLAQATRAQYGKNAMKLMPINLYGPGDSSTPPQPRDPGADRRVVEAVDGGETTSTSGARAGLPASSGSSTMLPGHRLAAEQLRQAIR